MDTLQKIVDLARLEDGKIFIADSTGEISAVVMSLSEYTKLKSGSVLDSLADRLKTLSAQTEELNRHITAAQMEDEQDSEEALPELEGVEVEQADTVYIEPLSEEG